MKENLRSREGKSKPDADSFFKKITGRLKLLTVLFSAVFSACAVFATTRHERVSIQVSVSGQTLRLFKDGRILHEYPVSTSKYGVGSEAGSDKTPLGKHRIARKIGRGAPLLAIFKSRVDTKKTAELNLSDHPSKEDFVTTRILWLEGLEPGLNRGGSVDSFARFIYIHATQDEGLIGRPASHGCIRMKNADVKELFDLVGVATPVEILP